MMNFSQGLFSLISLIIVIGVVTYGFFETSKVTKNPPKTQPAQTPSQKNTLDPEKTQIEEPTKNDFPTQIRLEVPFYPQAPDNNWSLPRSEACEEASIILAYHYIKRDSLSKEIFKKELLEIVELEKNVLGKYISTNIIETSEILEKYYNYKNFEIRLDPTIEDLKKELSLGHPIIVPLAGKKIGNIHYQNGGPKYHMLVLVGYNEQNFITHDVGTIRGEYYEYKFQTILDAIQDLDEKGNFLTGPEKNKILILK